MCTIHVSVNMSTRRHFATVTYHTCNAMCRYSQLCQLAILSAAHGNSTAACRQSVILSYTGSTSESGSITSLALWYTDVSTENLGSTLQTSAHQSLILRSTASTVSQSSSACRPTLPTEHLRPTGLFCRRPVCLELTTGRVPGSGH